jgi:poly(A) polymerase
MPAGAFFGLGRKPAVSEAHLDVPQALQSLLATLHDLLPGAWLVGGAVRDLAAGRTPIDLDVALPADARSAAGAIAASLGGTAFPLDIERGIARVALEDASIVAYIDVTSFSNGIEADLARRDFTIDAMAAQLRPDGDLGAVLDPHGGLQDLAQNCLRMVSDAVFTDDPLRLLRGVRLAVELDCEIDAATVETMRRDASLLPKAAFERQRDELLRMLETPRAAVAVRLLDALGLLDIVLPELTPARDTEQPPSHHFWDVFNHSVETLAALDQMLASEPVRASKRNKQYASLVSQQRPWLRREIEEQLAWFDLVSYLGERPAGASRRALLKLAGLLHDVSKPETKTVDSKGTHFYGHPEQGAVKAGTICRRLRLGNRDVAFVAKLVEEHLRPTQLAERRTLPSHRAVYRFFRDLGDAAPACLLLTLADATGATGPRLLPERWRGHVAYVSHVLSEGLAQVEEQAAQPKLIDGRELMQTLGLPQGPAVGRLLNAIDEARAAGEVSTREEAVALAQALLKSGPQAASQTTGPRPTRASGREPSRDAAKGADRTKNDTEGAA